MYAGVASSCIWLSERTPVLALLFFWFFIQFCIYLFLFYFFLIWLWADRAKVGVTSINLYKGCLPRAFCAGDVVM